MKKLLLVVAALVLVGAGCVESPSENSKMVDGAVQIIEYDKYGVTCWVYDTYYGGGISCLPNQTP